MRTKLPSELQAGDVLSSYDIHGYPLPGSRVLDQPTVVEGIAFVSTASGPLAMSADVPVEVEA